MKIVLYVPLIDEGSQTFVSQRPATPAIAGVAAVITRPLTGQVRPAIILSVDQTPHGTLANLVVFTDFGDPFRGATPDAAVRVARVPFSSTKEPGTFHNPDLQPALREYVAPGALSVLESMSTRLAIALRLSDEQKRQADRAESELNQVMRGDLKVSMPNDPLGVETVQQGGPISLVTAGRTLTGASLDGV